MHSFDEFVAAGSAAWGEQSSTQRVLRQHVSAEVSAILRHGQQNKQLHNLARCMHSFTCRLAARALLLRRNGSVLHHVGDMCTIGVRKEIGNYGNKDHWAISQLYRGHC